MWLIQGRHDTEPFCSQVTSPTVAADSRWQCQESRPAQAAATPHINLIYPCRSSSPGPATRSLSDEHIGKNTCMHTQNKMPDLMHTQTHTQLHTVTDRCKHKHMLYTHACIVKTSFPIPQHKFPLQAILCGQWNVWNSILHFCLQQLKYRTILFFSFCYQSSTMHNTTKMASIYCHICLSLCFCHYAQSRSNATILEHVCVIYSSN